MTPTDNTSDAIPTDVWQRSTTAAATLITAAGPDIDGLYVLHLAQARLRELIAELTGSLTMGVRSGETLETSAGHVGTVRWRSSGSWRLDELRPAVWASIRRRLVDDDLLRYVHPKTGELVASAQACEAMVREVWRSLPAPPRGSLRELGLDPDEYFERSSGPVPSVQFPAR